MIENGCRVMSLVVKFSRCSARHRSFKRLHCAALLGGLYGQCSVLSKVFEKSSVIIKISLWRFIGLVAVKQVHLYSR